MMSSSSKPKVTFPDGKKGKPSKKPKQDKAIAQEAQKKISSCKELKSKVLDLSKIDLNVLICNFKDLQHLTDLYLYKNKLPKIPDEIGTLVSLSHLALQENHLMTLASDRKQ